MLKIISMVEMVSSKKVHPNTNVIIWIKRINKVKLQHAMVLHVSESSFREMLLIFSLQTYESERDLMSDTNCVSVRYVLFEE